MAQKVILGRRGLESGPEGPVRGFDVPKMRLWSIPDVSMYEFTA